MILACGGFAYDTERLVQYLGVAPPDGVGTRDRTGDGVRLAQSVGADLWHMGAVSTSLGYRVPELDAGFYCEVRDDGFVLVDQLGRRYSDEGSFENHGAVHEMLARDGRTGRQLRAPSFLIFDERTRLAGPLRASRMARTPPIRGAKTIRPRWSAAGSLVPRPPAAGRGPGFPAAELEESVYVYNAACIEGTADPLGRSPERRRQIEGPPFYGTAVYPILLNTQGGPRRDEHGRILRPDGNPIPGLYGVGGELGSVWGPLYPGTGNISECLASGLLAAKSVCEQAPRCDHVLGDSGP